MIDRKKISDQARFCSILMGRIKNDIDNASDNYSGNGFKNYTAMQTDIIRLRRELLTLHKLLDPWHRGDWT